MENNMKYSEEQIIHSLQVIKDVCKCFNDCKECPFSIGKYSECGISDNNPYEWEFNVVTFKAFKQNRG